jgi:hypothetical protein
MGGFMTDRVAIPENCPSCDRRLVSNYLLAPRPKWQWRAKLLLLLGATISGILVILAWVFAGEVVGSLALKGGEQLGRKERREWGLLVFVIWAVGVAIALLPALGLGLIAARMRKLLKMKCRGCGWSESFVLSDRHTRSPGKDEHRAEPNLRA